MGSAAALVESQVRLAGGRAPAAEAAAAAPEAEAEVAANGPKYR